MALSLRIAIKWTYGTFFAAIGALAILFAVTGPLKAETIQRSLGSLVGDLSTLTTADGVAALSSPLVNYEDQDRKVLIIDGSSHYYVGRDGFDVLSPRLIDNDKLIVVIHKRAKSIGSINDIHGEYSIESCNIKTFNCVVLVQPNELKRVFGQLTIESISIFKIKDQHVMVTTSSSNDGRTGNYRIWRFSNGVIDALLKKIGAQSFGPLIASLKDDLVIFEGALLKPEDENLRNVCPKRAICLFAYDLSSNSYKNEREITNFKDLPLWDLSGEKDIFTDIYGSVSIINGKTFLYKSNSIKRSWGISECAFVADAVNPACSPREILKIRERGYFGKIAPIGDNSFVYSQLSEDGALIVSQFSLDGSSRVIFKGTPSSGQLIKTNQLKRG